MARETDEDRGTRRYGSRAAWGEWAAATRAETGAVGEKWPGIPLSG